MQLFQKRNNYIFSNQMSKKQNRSEANQKQVQAEIAKLEQKLQETNKNIKQTQKLLDVDLFLKQQKQKRIQYAQQLNADYEQQKKNREQKLYNKHRKKEKQTISNVQFKPQNIQALMPMQIIKNAMNYEKKVYGIREGHHYDEMKQLENDKILEEEEHLFEEFREKQNMGKIKYDGQKEKKDLVWKNGKQIVDNCLKMKVFPIEIKEGELIPIPQMENLFNAISLITTDISEKLFHRKQQSIACELNAPSKAVTIFSNLQLLIRQFPHKYVNIFSQSHDKNTIWPSLLEKLYRKFKKYIKMPITSSFVQSIYEVYGLDCEIIPINNKNIIKENFGLVLAHAQQEGRVGFMNISHNKNIYENRTYMLQYAREQENEVRYKIRNPWRGKLLEGQNRNYFNVLQLLQLFNVIVIMRNYPKTWKCLRTKVNYFSNGAVGLGNNEWTKNPQYLFTVSKSCKVRIILRKAANDFDKPDQEQIFGFLLFQNKEADTHISCMKVDQLIIKTKSNNFQQASHSVDLTKGNYVIIPYSTKKSEKSYQFYVLDLLVEREDYVHIGKMRYFDWNYETKGARLNEDKVIQKLQFVQKLQKPRVEVRETPQLFHNKLNKKILEELKLTLYENVNLSHFFIPGFIHHLLINPKLTTSIELAKHSAAPINQNEQLSKQERAQELSIILGYDALDDDINRGLMRQHEEQTAECFDFHSFGLGQEGLTAILECLSQQPEVRELDLSDNDLSDKSITYLCYYLQKSDRVETRKLNLSKNPFTKTGKRALHGLKLKYPRMLIIGPGFEI